MLFGESECAPIVIWKSENPRCFKHINKASLPVQYFSQKKSWMTGEILMSVLNKINCKLAKDKRSVLLFMDNAGCHPTDIAEKYSNIKIVYLPPNATSKLQPLDLGIIKTFKTYYRKFLMRYIITKVEECTSAAEVVKSVNILQAIRWIAEAWKSIDPATIKKCFRKAGMLDRELAVRQLQVLTEDPFSDLDDQVDSELVDLIRQVDENVQCSADCYVSADDELLTCSDMDHDTWEVEFFC